MSNAVKEVYLSMDVNGTVVTDGGRRGARTACFVPSWSTSWCATPAVGRLPRAARNALAFQKESGTNWTRHAPRGLRR